MYQAQGLQLTGVLAIATATPQLRLASALAEFWHQGQKYGSHDYYQWHIQGVVNSLIEAGASEEELIVAYLHDILEDTDFDAVFLYDHFGDVIAEAVDAINKLPDEPRSEYLERCCSNPIARKVKQHDAQFNLNSSLIATDAKAHKRVIKYNATLDFIAKVKERELD